MEKELSRYLWNGLDLDRYEVVDIIPKDAKNAVIIMRHRDPDDRHWCIEYLGSGHYFDTWDEMIAYYCKRFSPHRKHTQTY
jgi:hypothetical protein